jgi:hypothetical protein
VGKYVLCKIDRQDGVAVFGGDEKNDGGYENWSLEEPP